MIFKKRRKDGEVLPCNSCGCEVPTAEFQCGHPRGMRLLCDFCSFTMASRYTEYPSMDEFWRLRAEIWVAAANVYNMLKRKT